MEFGYIDFGYMEFGYMEFGYRVLIYVYGLMVITGLWQCWYSNFHLRLNSSEAICKVLEPLQIFLKIPPFAVQI